MASTLQRHMTDAGGIHRAPRMRKKSKRYQSEDEDEDVENTAPNTAPKSKHSAPPPKRIRMDTLKVFAALPAQADDMEEGLADTGDAMDLCDAVLGTLGQENAETKVEATQGAEEVAWQRHEGVGNPGQLKWVLLENFMCHEHFKMEFVPNVNFISGQNGSGKSALLQACQQVLGVSARETGRATSQSAFIRTGATEAKIRIALWNEGVDPLQPKVFGKEIVVERVIGKHSTWALYSASGVKVAKRRQDLDDLLSYFGIDGSNPITVMTQDVTRSFLAGSTDKLDKNKYAIYQTATMLDRVKAVNQIISMKAEEMHGSVAEAKSKFDKLKAERDEAKKALDNILAVDAVREEALHFEKVLAWAAFREMEGQARSLEDKIAEGPALVTQLEGQLREAREAEQRVRESMLEQNAAMDSFTEKAEELTAEMQKLQTEHKEASKPLKDAARGLRKMEADLVVLQESKQALLTAMKESEEDVYGALQAAVSQHDRVMQELQDKIATLETQKEAMLERQRTAQKKKMHAMSNGDAAKAEVDRLRHEVHKTGGEVASAKNQMKDRRTRFEPPFFGQAIHAHLRRFHRPPIGPIGYYLSLQDEGWAVAIEGALAKGRTLDSYLVHDHHDLQIFREIARQVNVRLPPVTVMRLDIPLHTLPPQRLPPPQLRTILQEIRVTEEAYKAPILNALVDVAHVEKTVLSDSEAEAKEAARHPNCMAAFVRTGANCVRRGATETTYPPGKYLRMRLTSNPADYLNHAKQQLEECQVLLQEAEQAWLMANAEVATAKAAFKQAQDDYLLARDQMGHAEDELTTQQSQAPDMPAAQAVDGDDGNAQEDLIENLQSIRDLEQRIQQAKSEFAELQAKETLAAEALLKARVRMDSLQESNQAALQSVSQRESALENAMQRVRELETTQDAMQGQVQSLTEKLKQSAADIAEYRAKAEEVCPEADAEAAAAALKAIYLAKEAWTEENVDLLIKAPESLSKMLDKTVKKIRAAEKEAGGLRAEVEARYMDLKVKVSDARARLQAIIDHYKKLSVAASDRRITCDRLERNAEELVGTLFNKYMARKGHTGSINIDHDAQTLEIKVKISGTKDGDKIKDLKQLSGGERSFTTVCFALALGEYVQSPFRAMDEFDVFMDAVNRRVSLVSLFENALLHPDVQFLLLTPQDISAVEEAKRHLMDERRVQIPDNFLKVVCMRPARPQNK